MHKSTLSISERLIDCLSICVPRTSREIARAKCLANVSSPDVSNSRTNDDLPTMENYLHADERVAFAVDLYFDFYK